MRQFSLAPSSAHGLGAGRIPFDTPERQIADAASRMPAIAAA
jgi:hypothetical protein